MRTTHLAVAITSFVLSCLVLSNLLLRAQSATPPNPDFVDALWVTQAHGISKISTGDAAMLFEMADTQNPRAIAVDAERGLVWVYRHNTLAGYTFDGGPAIKIPLGPHGDQGNSKNVALSVNPANGTVWLGVKETLYHFSRHGEWLHIHSLAGDVRALSWDATASCLVVGTKESVIALDDRGAVCYTLDLGPQPDVQGLTVDPTSGDIWLTLQKTLRRYDATRTLVLELSFDKVTTLASDHRGGIWLATDKELMRLDRFGPMLSARMPFKGPDKIVALVADPADASIWVASKNRISHISTDGRHLDQLGLKGEIRHLAFYTDKIPPILTIATPYDDALLHTNMPAIRLDYRDTGTGVDVSTLRLQMNGSDLTVACQHAQTRSTCTPTDLLPEGVVLLTAQIRDYAGNTAEADAVRFTVDTLPPVITVTTPADGTYTNQPVQSFAGYLSEVATLTLNGAGVQVGPDLRFSQGSVVLQEGLNTAVLVATDAAGHSSQHRIHITLDMVPPAVLTEVQLTLSQETDGQVRVTGQSGSVEPGATVTITNIRTGETLTVVAIEDGSFTGVLVAQRGDELSVVASDVAGNRSAPLTVGVNGAFAAVPTIVAPPLDRMPATDLASATTFLYSGSQPLQTGVSPGTIEPKRVAVLRGRVQTRDGSPLPGVIITVVGHPEYGQTVTRADGMFDMAVNGGGSLTVRYEREGHFPVQRQIQVPWRNYAWLPDVVMTPVDGRATAIDLAALADVQAARGSVMTDADGARQATLLFAPGTHATMVMADGSAEPLQTLHVRATEYTVGDSGPKAMPATLPAASAYTYAVELSIDEAEAAEATRVEFSQPVIFYVENFLNFPVGLNVPMGFYDPHQSTWVPSENGRIIKMLDLSGGVPGVDIDGDGEPDTEAELTALGLTEAERQRLATLYEPGQSLWRIPVTHFSSWDANWGWGPPSDATAPLQRDPAPTGGEPLDDPTCVDGSIIRTENQSLGEVVGIAGTPFSLHYQSDRVPGYTAGNTLQIPLSGMSIPPSLQHILLEIEVAGQRVTQSFWPAPDLKASFTWDGLDAYGRALPGAQPITVRIGYTYRGSYQQVERFGYSGNGTPISGSLTRQEVTLWQEWQSTIGAWNAQSQGMGGWTLDVHHAYDPVSRVLYSGNGGRRSAKQLGYAIATVAGNGILGFSGDGGPAAEAQIRSISAIAIGPDGSVYVTDSGRVRRIAPDGIITTVAGDGTAGFSGDGGPATQAQLDYPQGVAVGPDGSLYIADTGNHRIRRVGPDGIIMTVAGPGTYRVLGDGDPASQAWFRYPMGLAFGPDSSLYIADYSNYRVRRVGPDGIITTVAGNGSAQFSGDGGPATQAGLWGLSALAVGADGSLYIPTSGHSRVRRVGPDGIITTVAGNGIIGSSGDGGSATQAALDSPMGVAVGRDGALYIADFDNSRIRRVGPDGVITTVVGSGAYGFSGDGGPATQARLSFPVAVAIGPDDTLYVADLYNIRIRRVELPLSGYSPDDIVIPSADGREIYLFNRAGQHQRTLHALTGTLRYQFGYDMVGLLTSVTDGDGNVTTIERDAVGNPLALVSPFGLQTTWNLDAHGYVASLATPAGELLRMTYRADGLLTALRNARGHDHQFSYDEVGRLIRDEDPAGGFKALARAELPSGFAVAVSTGMGRTTHYQVENTPTGDRHRTNTRPSGIQDVRASGNNGNRQAVLPDGTLQSLWLAGDPRFGMQSPVSTRAEFKTPGGLLSTVTASKTVTLSDPHNPLSLLTQTDTVGLNGKVYTSVFDASQRRITDRSPAGREKTVSFDAQGRPVEKQVDGLEPWRMTYDNSGRLASMTQGSRSAILSYNPRGQLEQIVDALNRSTRYEYDTVGRLIRQLFPDGREVLYTYDANGNVTSITPPGRPIHAFTYTPVDQEESYLPPPFEASDMPTQYAYNLDRQLVQIMRPDSSTVDFGYDGAGRLSTLTLPRGQVLFDYSSLTGNLTSLTAPDGSTLTYGYDGSLLTSEAWSGSITGSVQYGYDHDFRVTSMSLNGAPHVSLQYDPDGLLTQAGDLALDYHAQNGFLTGTALGHITDARSYNSVGELSGYRASFVGGDVLTVQYDRDAMGRITQKWETSDGQTKDYHYTYDLAGRLTEVKKDGVVIGSYLYDSNGNRLSYSNGDGTVHASYDAQDRLTQYGATTYTYTANGELATKTTGLQTTTYLYDALGNLMAATLPDGTQVDYLIDGLNRRIGKKVNGALRRGILYSGSLAPVAELDGSGTIIARFIYATRVNVPDYMIKGGWTYRIITDHLGSPRLVIDTTTGHIVQRLDYDAFGRVIFDDNPGFQPFGFAGGLYDPDTRLTRFGARDYDAETGRWTAKDPIRFAGGDTNLYGYVLNDPVNWVDPYGLFLGSALTKLMGKIVGTTPAEQAFVGKLGDSIVGVTLAFAGQEIIPEQIKKIVGPTTILGMQAQGTLQTLSLSSLTIGYAPWIVPFSLAGLGGLEFGFLINDIYKLISGKMLGEDLYDWFNGELKFGQQRSCR